TLSTRASCMTASRTFSNSSRKVIALACTELLSSTMLSVISGFTAPGSLRLPRRRRSSSASRARSKSCGRTSCSSSSTPTVSGAERRRRLCASGRGAGGRGRRNGVGGGAEGLGNHPRGKSHRRELPAEGGIERDGVAHHDHRRARERNEREGEQAGAAGPDAR